MAVKHLQEPLPIENLEKLDVPPWFLDFVEKCTENVVLP